MKGATDRLYWRMLPVGLATAFLSGVWLSVLLGLAAGKAVGGWLEVGLSAGMGLAGLLVAALVWIPLLVLWNVFVFRLAPGGSLRRRAAVMSGGMAFLVTLSTTALFSGALEGLRSALLFGGWIIGTTALATGLTHWSFGADEEVMA